MGDDRRSRGKVKIMGIVLRPVIVGKVEIPVVEKAVGDQKVMRFIT